MEGGLGVRDLVSVQIAFSVKMLWNIIHGSSLWSIYARQRFLKAHLASSRIAFPAGLPMKVFKQARDIILDNSRWFTGSGDLIDFLRDNWT